jgi:hypothetical protein
LRLFQPPVTRATGRNLQGLVCNFLYFPRRLCKCWVVNHIFVKYRTRFSKKIAGSARTIRSFATLASVSADYRRPSVDRRPDCRP